MDFAKKSGGVVGPHTCYAMPGRMLHGLSNDRDRGGRTGMVEYTNEVVWNLHARKPRKVLDVPGAPLEVRCAWQPNEPQLLLHHDGPDLEDLAHPRGHRGRHPV